MMQQLIDPKRKPVPKPSDINRRLLELLLALPDTPRHAEQSSSRAASQRTGKTGRDGGGADQAIIHSRQRFERQFLQIKRRTLRRTALRRNVIMGVVLVLTASAVAAVGMHERVNRHYRGTDDPVPTLVATTRTADVPVYLDGIGTTKALNTVTVSSQVAGTLTGIFFKEGQDVDQGFVLAQIDPTVYRALYDQAVAKKAQDEATLSNAKTDLARYQRLAEVRSVPQQQADTQTALVAQLEALVKADRAAIDNQRAFLDFTKITAPIAGRTGIRQIDAGNVVQGSTPIVLITQLRPISIIFTLPQQQLGQVSEALAAGAVGVEVFGPDNRTVIAHGNLLVVDNQIDQATGTFKLKAEFPNHDLKLWPGQFVNVRVLVDTLRQAAVVPTAAVQRGPNGTFVFLATDDKTVAMRPVDVVMQDETQSVIGSGLQIGDRVVTTGFNRLADGQRISVDNAAGDGKLATVPKADPPSRSPNDFQSRWLDEKPSRTGGNDVAQSGQPQRDDRRRAERDSTDKTR